MRLVNLLITQAITDHASDIHVEPTGKDVRIRYRIDGVLHEVMRSPRNIQNGMISRLKVMADINIAERRIPQDGRISTTIDGRPVDLRVATLPTVNGEKVVMRILDKNQAELRLSDLGFLPDNMKRYEISYTKPYGTVLVTGPTGSGKTTTLYATLNILNQVSKNVITVEDPVEYQLDGINQIQVNNKAGLTFASALRTILRADPDIILVGEIRDRETAAIAVEAALTGHLVLSTIHTNDASTTPNRLIEMGVEPFLVGSALDCIVAQRLARKLCDRCKQDFPVEPDKLEGLGLGPRGAGDPRPFLPLGGLPALREDRLCRTVRGPRSAQCQRRNRAHDRRACPCRRNPQGRGSGRDADAAPRRPYGGGSRDYLARRGPQGDRLSRDMMNNERTRNEAGP